MTADSFILLGKDQTDGNLFPAHILPSQSKNNVFHGFCIHFSHIPASLALNVYGRVTEEQKGTGGLDNGQDRPGGWGEGKKGSLLLGTTVTCQQPARWSYSWPVAREKTPIEDLLSPNSRKYVELDRLPRKPRFLRAGFDNGTEFLSC